MSENVRVVLEHCEVSGIKRNKEKLRAGLQALLDNGPVDADFGVCYNLQALTNSPVAYALMEYAGDSWAKARRDAHGQLRMYFVPDNPYQHRWEGVNLEYRRELIKHALTVLEEF